MSTKNQSYWAWLVLLALAIVGIESLLFDPAVLAATAILFVATFPVMELFGDINDPPPWRATFVTISTITAISIYLPVIAGTTGLVFLCGLALYRVAELAYNTYKARKSKNGKRRAHTHEGKPNK